MVDKNSAQKNPSDVTSEDVKKTNQELAEMGLDPIPDPTEPDYVMSAGKNPYPLLIMENICRYLEAYYKDQFRFNEFSHSTEVKRPDGTWSDLQDSDILTLQREISSDREYFAKISKMLVADAVISVGSQTVINPPRDYILSLKWDNKPRLNMWLTEAYGVELSELNAAIGSNWFKGLAKRILHPGCQFDEVLVLEGDQGTRKSTSLRVLGSPWHVETTYSSDKDFFQILAKNCIVEFSEGDILSRAGVRAVKALITKTEDQYRIPYERHPVNLKRGCVFAMTTNDTQYLKDETGNRRWLPVKLEGDANIDWLEANRDQLYAEAVHRVEVLKETTWEYPDELTELQESRTEQEAHMEEVEDWYLSISVRKRDHGITAKEVYYQLFMNDEGGGETPSSTAINKSVIMPKNMEWEIGRILRKMGLKNATCRRNNRMVRRWFPTDLTRERYKGVWKSNTGPEEDDF